MFLFYFCLFFQAASAIDAGVETILRSSVCAAALAFKKLEGENNAAISLLQEELKDTQGKTEREKQKQLEDAAKSKVKEAKKAVRHHFLGFRV